MPTVPASLRDTRTGDLPGVLLIARLPLSAMDCLWSFGSRPSRPLRESHAAGHRHDRDAQRYQHVFLIELRPVRDYDTPTRAVVPAFGPAHPRNLTHQEAVWMFRSIVIDCQDLERQAAFWTAVSGFEQRWTDGTYLLLIDPAQPAPTILLQRVTEGKQGKNRLHLDFAAADMDAEVARLVTLGAQTVQRFDEYRGFTVMLDPEGNEFCIVQEQHG
jgi:predicted enzyme related to lactoylglutathione lyase